MILITKTSDQTRVCVCVCVFFFFFFFVCVFLTLTGRASTIAYLKNKRKCSSNRIKSNTRRFFYKSLEPNR